MTQQVLPDAYCTDTSALIDLWRDYPPDVFEGVWRNVENLVRERRIVAPAEVFAELEPTDDEVLEWAKKHRSMFRACDAEQVAEVQRILTEFPTLIDEDREIPDADPFVVAMGKKGYGVVTSEKPSGAGARPKIPNVCARYRIGCFSLVDLFRNEGWRWPA